jgi:hypothetical protein
VVPFCAVSVNTPVDAEPPKHPVMLFALLDAAPADIPACPAALPWLPMELLLFCVPIDEPGALCEFGLV